MQDRHGEVSSLGLTTSGRADGSNTASQPEQSSANNSNTTQSLKPQTWHSGSGSWIGPGQSDRPKDEHGLNRIDAPINTHDFPSLAATAKQPVHSRLRSQVDQVCTPVLKCAFCRLRRPLAACAV